MLKTIRKVRELLQANTSSFQTSDGLTLFARSFLPVGSARAAVIVSHGYAEHSGRYLAVAQTLVSAGYAVYALDHRGHGQSEGRRANVRVFGDYVHDLARFVDLVRETRPHPPRFLFGHSMGALVALQLVLEHPEKVEGVALSAAFMQNAVPLARPLEAAAGWVSRLFPDLPVQALDLQALARDEAVVQAYSDDPLVYHGKVKARLGYELLRTGPYVTGRAPSIDVPILLQHGGADRIAAVSGSQMLFGRIGSADKTLKLYEGAYHEIFNDYGKKDVLDDLLAWLDARVDHR